MIRKLHEADRTVVVALLEKAAQVNLYLLGNLETLGFDGKVCEYWGDFSDDGGRVLRGVLNRYMNSWSIYGDAGADWQGLVKVVESFPAARYRLNDNPGGTATILPYLRRYRAEPVEVAELMCVDGEHFRPAVRPAELLVRRASMADLAALVRFYSNAEHMTRQPPAVERPLLDTRVWLGEVQGTLVSVAVTNAETSKMAMIGGVYTPPEYRGRGYSQAVCSALCRELLAQNRQPVLYWVTPAAGALYRKLGFQVVGTWRSTWIEPAS